MTVQEALTQMHEVVGAAKERLEGNGFVMSIQTFYYDAMLRVIPNEKRARFATVTLIVNKVDGKEGEEYCLSLGVAILGKKANAKRLAKTALNCERGKPQLCRHPGQHDVQRGDHGRLTEIARF